MSSVKQFMDGDQHKNMSKIKRPTLNVFYVQDAFLNIQDALLDVHYTFLNVQDTFLNAQDVFLNVQDTQDAILNV